MHAIRIEEARSELAVTAPLLRAEAPENVAFLWDWLATPRAVPAIHSMWTGPEIVAALPDAGRTEPLPLECATVMPQPGEVVLSHLPARAWAGTADPPFHLGLFYAPGARMFLPIGWHPGSVVARIPPEQVPAVAAACRRIRQNGACTLTLARAGAPAAAPLPEPRTAS